MPDTDELPSPEAERRQAQERRQRLGVRRPPDQHQAQWAVALSGGGIRSATFCLGALQGLARSPGPDPVESDGPALPLIAQFDYLSTVSGGGYIGSFFTSLFVKGRLSGDDTESDLTATRRAYQALCDDPPARVHADTVYDPAHPGRAALAWLRDNGRYLAPSGAGDVLYGMGVALRNWAATHYVVGTMILMGLGLILSLRLALALHCPAYARWESELRAAAGATGGGIWWSPSWALCAAVFVLASGPAGMAFWFSHPAKTGSTRQRRRIGDPNATRPRLFTLASSLGLVIAAGLGAVGWSVGWEDGPRQALGRSVSGCGAYVALAVACYMASAWVSRRHTITLQRVLLTRCIAKSLMLIIVLALLAAVETLAQTAWLTLHWQTGLVTGGLISGLVWLLRAGAPKLADQSAMAWLERLPLDLLAGVLGIALWVVVSAAFYLLLLNVVWFGHELRTLADTFTRRAITHELLCYAAGSLAVITGLALVVGRFPGFLNLSTFQSLYSARLTRAYLGATNFRRFSDRARARHRDVAEPIDGDGLDIHTPYANTTAPIHFINVCINQTVSPGEQLVQRDRKGKPLVIAPRGHYLDDSAHGATQRKVRNELTYPLSFGDWIGVSGAAFSTGLGRNNGLGFSLILGFANVRLGRWWPGLPGSGAVPSHWIRRIFTTQTYLIDEIRGLFYGSHRPYQYLSDGGHFDNTGVYELIKPGRDRGVRLIVLCDCGCDPDYEFKDLANLIRLARIDHGLEIRVNERAAQHPLLGAHFGRPADFRRQPDGRLPPPATRCAVLLDVLSTARDSAMAPGTLVARIVLLKPVLMSDAPVDLAHYQATHGSFPQQSTGDQFFDEAQWESYRQLGVGTVRRVFPQDAASPYGQAFWRVCLGGLPG